jgi:osmoprotectant transport system permease protein
VNFVAYSKVNPGGRRRGLTSSAMHAALFSPLIGLLLAMAAQGVHAQEPLRIGSKRFTESYILGEVLSRTAAQGGPAVHRPGLGNTGILHAALRSGSIDAYPEYSGTIAKEILKLPGDPGIGELNRALAPLGLAASVPLGFNNGYAIGMREETASRLGVRSLSDLARQPSVRLGLSHEFLARPDGWPGLARAYGLGKLSIAALDHGIAYEALEAGRIEAMDLYTTDAKIERYSIRTLEDDRHFFPRYDALLLHRADAPARFPAQWKALASLQGRIDEKTMMRMNAAAELEGRSFADAASVFFGTAPAESSGRRSFMDALLAPDLGRLTIEHLLLVFISLAAAILAGIPLGIAAWRSPGLAQPIFALVGLFQTIPSLALLAFLIALVGSIGTFPAMIALFLYALLPIVRNTHTGLEGVGRGLRQAALALGLRARQRLWLVDLPLARRSILAGIKTSAVINVGTATIAAFIGAGGYGERIASGLALNDNVQLLAGAVPAAVLALAIQGAFELLERRAGAFRA